MNSNVMRLDLGKGEISWLVVALLVLQQLVSTYVFLVICCGVTLFLGLRYLPRWTKVMPKGVTAIALVGFVGIIIGTMNSYSVLRIVRSSSYWLNGFLSIFLCMIIILANGNKRITSSLVIAHLFISLYCMWRLLTTAGFSSYVALRSSLSLNIEELAFVFPVLLVNRYVYWETTVTESIDRLAIIVFLVRLIFSLSRTVILGVFIGLALFYVLIGRNYRNQRRLFFNILVFGIIICILIFMIYNLAPEATRSYLDKLFNSRDELSAGTVFSTYSDALANWRPYENQQAMTQWGEYGLFEKLFGNGFGGIVKMQYIPTSWSGMEFYSSGGIPLLHNGYLTVLCISGLLGLLVYLRFYISNIRVALDIRRRITSGEKRRAADIYLVILCIMMVNMYVIRGLYSGAMYLTWGCLLAENYYAMRYGE